jgi:hypothetical protein
LWESRFWELCWQRGKACKWCSRWLQAGGVRSGEGRSEACVQRESFGWEREILMRARHGAVSGKRGKEKDESAVCGEGQLREGKVRWGGAASLSSESKSRKVGVVAAGCCGEDRRVKRSVEMGGVPLAFVYLCGFSGLLCQG